MLAEMSQIAPIAAIHGKTVCVNVRCFATAVVTAFVACESASGTKESNVDAAAARKTSVATRRAKWLRTRSQMNANGVVGTRDSGCASAKLSGRNNTSSGMI